MYTTIAIVDYQFTTITIVDYQFTTITIVDSQRVEWLISTFQPQRLQALILNKLILKSKHEISIPS